MDKKLRDEVVNVVALAVQQVQEAYCEKWVTAENLISQYQLFTKDWLRRYGHSLPRRRACVCDEGGQKHQTGWVYPLHRIGGMIDSGEISHLRCLTVSIQEGNRMNM